MSLGTVRTLGTLGTPNGMKVFYLLQTEGATTLELCDSDDVILYKDELNLLSFIVLKLPPHTYTQAHTHTHI